VELWPDRRSCGMFKEYAYVDSSIKLTSAPQIVVPQTDAWDEDPKVILSGVLDSFQRVLIFRFARDSLTARKIVRITAGP